MVNDGKTQEDAVVVSVAPELLTLPEAAAYLRLARQTVYNLVSRRQIPFLRAGRQLRFRRTELDRWLAEKAVA